MTGKEEQWKEIIQLKGEKYSQLLGLEVFENVIPLKPRDEPIMRE